MRSCPDTEIGPLSVRLTLFASFLVERLKETCHDIVNIYPNENDQNTIWNSFRLSFATPRIKQLKWAKKKRN